MCVHLSFICLNQKIFLILLSVIKHDRMYFIWDGHSAKSSNYIKQLIKFFWKLSFIGWTDQKIKTMYPRYGKKIHRCKIHFKILNLTFYCYVKKNINELVRKYQMLSWRLQLDFSNSLLMIKRELAFRQKFDPRKNWFFLNKSLWGFCVMVFYLVHVSK